MLLFLIEVAGTVICLLSLENVYVRSAPRPAYLVLFVLVFSWWIFFICTDSCFFDDFEVKILCHLHHDQLRAVFHVSQRIRKAVSAYLSLSGRGRAVCMCN